MVLQWAIQQKMERICIKTDCEVFVQGLMDWRSAPFDVQPALSDFCSLCSNFLVVKVLRCKDWQLRSPITKLRRPYRICDVVYVLYICSFI